MIEVKIRKVKVTKSILRQMVVKYDYKSLRDAAVTRGWFYGEATLGREYSRGPYVLCEDPDGNPFLHRAEVYDLVDTNLLVANRSVPQIFV